MAGVPTQLTDLPTLPAQAAEDWLYIVDASNLTESGAGSSNKVSAGRWAWTNGVPATITGGGTIALGGFTMTVPATGEVVTTTASQILSGKTFSDNVGIGITPAATRLHVFRDSTAEAEVRIENPNGGVGSSSFLRLITDGGGLEALLLVKYPKTNTTYPNGAVLINTEGNLNLVTDSGTLVMTDSGAFSFTGPAGSMFLNTDGTLALPGGVSVAGNVISAGTITAANLTVSGTITALGGITLGNNDALRWENISGTPIHGMLLNSNDDLAIGSGLTAANLVHIQPGGGYKLIVQGDGKVGIGKVPTTTLDVNGTVTATAVTISGAFSVTNVAASGTLAVAGATDFGGTVTLDNNDALRWENTSGTPVNVLLLNATNDLAIGGGLTAADFITIGFAGAKVGIGKAPTVALDVNGTVAATALDVDGATTTTALDVDGATTTTTLTVTGTAQAGKIGGAWTAIPLSVGWVAGPIAPQYKKFGDMVFLRGMVMKDGGGSSTSDHILTLPVGVRPGVYQVNITNNTVPTGLSSLKIENTGSVFFFADGLVTHVSLDGAIFSTSAT